MLRHLKLKMEVKMKTMSFSIADEKLSEKYQAIWNKIEDLKDVELNVLPVYDDRCIKSKIRTYYHQVYTNIRGLNVSEDDIECDWFTVISIGFLLVYENSVLIKL